MYLRRPPFLWSPLPGPEAKGSDVTNHVTAADEQALQLPRRSERLSVNSAPSGKSDCTRGFYDVTREMQSSPVFPNETDTAKCHHKCIETHGIECYTLISKLTSKTKR